MIYYKESVDPLSSSEFKNNVSTTDLTNSKRSSTKRIFENDDNKRKKGIHKFCCKPF